jgi:hypothetical protein
VDLGVEFALAEFRRHGRLRDAAVSHLCGTP